MPSAASNRPITPDMGTSFFFHKSAAEKVYETTENSLYRAGPLTVMAWVRFQNPTGAANQLTVVGKGKQTAANLCWSLAINNAGTVRAEVSSAGNNTLAVTSTVTVSSGTWHHLAMVYDPSITSLTAYLDGVSVATSAGAPATLFASTMPVTVGATSSAVGTVIFPFSGMIQEAAVVTQALNAAQLLSLMAGGAIGVLKQIASGATYSVWVTGEDAGLNTATLPDKGNAGSGLTLSIAGTTQDWFGRTRPRMGLYSLRDMPMNAAAETSTILSDATNGWNANCRSNDLLLVPNGFQSLLASPGAPRGLLAFGYTVYDSTSGGTGLGMLQDHNAGYPGWSGATPFALAYDVEVWANTPANESSDPVTFCQNCCRIAHGDGYKFAAVPSLGIAQTGTNAHDIAVITDSNGKPGCDLFFLQTQSHDSSVDEYCLNVFPLCQTIFNASPTTQIWIQVQNFKVGNTKIADQFDLAQIIWNTDTFLRSIGKSDGLNGWGFFIAPGTNVTQLISNWGDLRRFIRSSGRSQATRSTLRP